MATPFKQKRTSGSDASYTLAEHLMADNPHGQYVKRIVDADELNAQLAAHITAGAEDDLRHRQYVIGVNSYSILLSKGLDKLARYTLNGTGIVELQTALDTHTHSGYATSAHTHAGYALVGHDHSDYALVSVLTDMGMTADTEQVAGTEPPIDVNTAYASFLASITGSPYHNLQYYPAGTQCTNSYGGTDTVWERTLSTWITMVTPSVNLDNITELSVMRVATPASVYNAPSSVAGIIATRYVTAGAPQLSVAHNVINAATVAVSLEMSLEFCYLETTNTKIYVYGTVPGGDLQNQWWERTGETTWAIMVTPPADTKVYSSVTTAAGNVVIQTYTTDNGVVYVRTGVYTPTIVHDDSAKTTVDKSYRNFSTWGTGTDSLSTIREVTSNTATTTISATNARYVTIVPSANTALVITNLALGYRLTVYIDNSAAKTITFNGVTLTSTNQRVLAEFINITGTVICTSSSATIA